MADAEQAHASKRILASKQLEASHAKDIKENCVLDTYENAIEKATHSM